MTTAIVIGCYRLVPFITLNILRCRRLWPDAPIILSDDLSPDSPAIQKLAEKYECDYACPTRRRSHFSGDMQSFLNGLQFARELDADIILKLSQRLIPVLPEFRSALELAMSDEQCQVCLPGQMNKLQISRPTALFYRKFGILTDVLALRTSAITPDDLLAVYRERAGTGSKGRPVSDSFSETTWGWLLDKRFPGARHRILPEWTHHRPGQAKLYLRKSQSSFLDYAQVGTMEGVKADWDLREWIQIEGRHGYKPKADIV